MMKTNFLAALLVFAVTLSCTRNDAQQDFERDAYKTPQNFTETNHTGKIISTDEDDWRISPLYQGLVHVNPPFPNPVSSSDNLQFEIEITGVQSVSGLEVITRYDNANPTSGFKTLYFETQTLMPGLTTFTINPLELGRNDVIESARGLHRIFIYDGNGNMISYGDVMVE